MAPINLHINSLSWLIRDLCMWKRGYKDLKKRKNEKFEKIEQICLMK